VVRKKKNNTYRKDGILLMRKITDEEIIVAINEYMRIHPDANRTKIIIKAKGPQERIRKLLKEGKVTLPTPLRSGCNSGWNRRFT
jgi:hypothetical protein